jgi:protein-S-isoprenylcysteine O-methyltransferase Ste14
MGAAMNTASNAVKTGLFTLFVPLVVALWIPQRMIANGQAGVAVPALWRMLGVLLFSLGAAGYFWCAALFVGAQGTPAPIFPTRKTVSTGLYRINRNPMYSSVLAVVFGQALFYRSVRVAEYGAFLAICLHLFVVSYEERDLRARFNGEYEEFCRQVPRWIPRLPRSADR